MDITDTFLLDLNYDWSTLPYTKKYGKLFKNQKLDPFFLTKCTTKHIEDIKKFYVAYNIITNVGIVLNKDIIFNEICRSFFVVDNLNCPDIETQISNGVAKVKMMHDPSLSSLFIQFEGLSLSSISNTLASYQLKNKPHCDAILLGNKRTIPINFY